MPDQVLLEDDDKNDVRVRSFKQFVAHKNYSYTKRKRKNSITFKIIKLTHSLKHNFFYMAIELGLIYT